MSELHCKPVEFPSNSHPLDYILYDCDNPDIDRYTLKSQNCDWNKLIEIKIPEQLGGKYSDVKKTSNGEKHEVHHIPSDFASDLPRDDGPCIKMNKEDHRLTASYGNSKEAREYRDIQKKLIQEGKFREALQMDIDDIREKFGDKYDDAIEEMLNYVDILEKKGVI